MTLEKTVAIFLEEKKYKTLRDIITVMQPFDIAQMFDEMTNDKRIVLFRLLPKELAAEVFVLLDEDIQQQLISGFTDSEIAAVINEMYVDDVADMIEEMPASVVKRVLGQASSDMRKMINEVLKYPDDSAGSLMNTEYISLRSTMTVEEALLHIRKTGIDKETLNTLYVLGNSRTLIGVLPIRMLIFANPQDVIENIMDKSEIVTVNTLDDKENVARAFENYDLTELPVVDKENRLVGIVTVDDAIDVLQEEATEDIEKMAAISPSDKPYLKMSAIEIFSKRIPWLLILMISATFTGIIISAFESALGILPILTAFIPMLMNTGGNCGSQSSVTVIRSLSLEDIEFKDIFRVLFKEFRVSIYCGIALSIVSFGKVYLIDKLIMGKEITVMVALVVSITLLATVIISKLVGCSLPFIAKKLGFDPTVMASPFITTIIDALSLLIYFGFASAILNL